ncbi:maleylpyruvate isomerase N-terminal domain-containing protein [Arthrobacter sp. UYCo732]|uniref:maleylpyruvate isomerase N-terminal domain-containing protein n=1 Tax=Arthrobacter sp. UYCo732 TaxID=3156336 RepID=UPI00339266D8
MPPQLPSPDLKNLLTALRAESALMLDFANDLTTQQWNSPSRATGWTVADIVGHIGSTAHNFYIPAGIRAARQPSLEKANEGPVRVRRGWDREQVMDEFEKSTRSVANMLAFVRHTPLRSLPTRLNELGTYPLGLLIGGALAFDLHTHLRHDIAPALGVSAPETDADRMRAVLTWMTAVLSNQTKAAPSTGIEAGLTLTLTGPGGGSWRVDETGLASSAQRPTAAHITAPAITFPDWGTRRSSWHDSPLQIDGDHEMASRYLNTVNVI